MPPISNSEVYTFLGLASDQQTTHATLITNLISTMTVELEQMIGRKVENETFTDVLFEDGLNCRLQDDLLFLQGKYRDIHTITSISEDRSALTVVSDSDDFNDYYLNSRLGYIKRVDRYWSCLPSAIKISGSLGLIAPGDTSSTRGDVKQILFEMVAAKSGLWRINTETEDGTVTTIRTNYSAETRKKIKALQLRDI